VVDHTFELQLDKTQDNESGIYCFSVNHAVIKSQDNVSEWSDMSISKKKLHFHEMMMTVCTRLIRLVGFLQCQLIETTIHG
jgi:hypothetical protein